MHRSLPDTAAQASTPASSSDHAQDHLTTAHAAPDHYSQASPAPTAARDLSFREILIMSSPQERIKAFNSTRQHLATQDSGLTNWLQTTGSQYPEHRDLLNQNGHLLSQQINAIHSHKPSPLGPSFPELVLHLVAQVSSLMQTITTQTRLLLAVHRAAN